MKLINFELDSIQPLVLLLGDSGSIYLSVNTTTDCGRSCNGYPVETVDTLLLQTKA